MLSVPSVFPKDSHDIWYSSTYKPHVVRRSTKPKSQFLPGSTSQDDDDDSAPSNNNRPGTHTAPLTVLESAEADLVQNMESIRTFGFTFLRPPGFTKTEQALLEEQTLSDSESEDNGLIENPNGDLVMVDGEEQQEQDELGDDGEEEELEEEDNEDEDELDEDEVAEEALDGWPRRRRRRRYRTVTYAEEIDLDADIPEGEDLGMDYGDEDYEDEEEEEEEEDEDEDEEAAAPDEHHEQDGYDEESRQMETPRRETTQAFTVQSDDDYEMGMEFDEDNE
ncbi:hypothetical protein V1525DRAFT_406206 [Lipomyces kononenkoae]|uniref:Uncharacterized protein n=1 Tax=Lipomyces kononenkoae TaxID=34357 RepID=A0ACC3SYG5_LIPKO